MTVLIVYSTGVALLVLLTILDAAVRHTRRKRP